MDETLVGSPSVQSPRTDHVHVRLDGFVEATEADGPQWSGTWRYLHCEPPPKPYRFTYKVPSQLRGVR